MAKIEEEVETLLQNKINELGYELYDVEYVKEGKNYILRIFIDNTKGISIEDCEKVSNGINDILDEANYIKDQYILEVSSPGIERTLKKDRHLEQNIGKEIEIKLFKKDENNMKEYRGLLESYDSEYITIKSSDEIKIDRKKIAHIKTIYNW